MWIVQLVTCVSEARNRSRGVGTRRLSVRPAARRQETEVAPPRDCGQLKLESKGTGEPRAQGIAASKVGAWLGALVPRSGWDLGPGVPAATTPSPAAASLVCESLKTKTLSRSE